MTKTYIMHLEPLIGGLWPIEKMITLEKNQNVQSEFMKSELSKKYKLVSISDGYPQLISNRKRRLKLIAKICLVILWAIFSGKLNKCTLPNKSFPCSKL